MNKADKALDTIEATLKGKADAAMHDFFFRSKPDTLPTFEEFGALTNHSMFDLRQLPSFEACRLFQRARLITLVVSGTSKSIPAWLPLLLGFDPEGGQAEEPVIIIRDNIPDCSDCPKAKED